MFLRKDLSKTQETLKSFFREILDRKLHLYNPLITSRIHNIYKYFIFPQPRLKSPFRYFWQIWKEWENAIPVFNSSKKPCNDYLPIQGTMNTRNIISSSYQFDFLFINIYLATQLEEGANFTLLLFWRYRQTPITMQTRKLTPIGGAFT